MQTAPPASAPQVGVKVVRQLIGATSMLMAARAFHEALVKSVLGSALSFFHVTPHGRILNRFSGDMSIIDSNFHKEIYEVVEMGLNLVRCGAAAATHRV